MVINYMLIGMFDQLMPSYSFLFKVMLWRKTKIRESNQCLGEARITLDILEETTHSTAWYTLFPSGAYESLKSSQSLELLKF